MVKECVKKCSSCGYNGRNARSCQKINNNNNNNKEICLKLFGFKIHVPHKLESDTSSSVMRKCKSTPNLIACDRDHGSDDAGYLSDGPGVHQKKRGVPWTEDEHLSFLSGLENLGKGDWKGISRNYVHSRTATQVASHAQKYFKRLNLPDKRNRRSSLFDMSLNQPEIKKSRPPESPDAMKDELLKRADNLPALDMNQKGVTEEQANTFAKAAATPLTVPLVLPYPCGVPNFSQMPYIPVMGLTNNGQIFPGAKTFPAMPSVPVMYMPNPANFYMPKCPESQASSTLSMPALTHGLPPPMARP